MPDLWGMLSILAKFALYLGILTSAGTVFAATVLGTVKIPYRRIATPFIGLAFIGTIVTFLLRGAALTGDTSGMTDPEMLGLLWQTPIGTALVWRTAGVGLMCLGIIMGKPGLWLCVAGGVAAIWSFAQVGHIPDKELVLLKLALVLHLIGIAFWIGILIPLTRLIKSGDLSETARLGQRFGGVAAALVPALIVAGGYMAYQLVGTFSALIHSAYGIGLLAKIAGVAGLLTLAAANKLRFVPSIKRGDTTAAQHLLLSIKCEWLLFIAILLLTSVLTSALGPT